VPTALRTGRTLRYAARATATLAQAAAWPEDMTTVALHLLAEHIEADPGGHPQLWQRRVDAWHAFTTADEHSEAQQWVERRLDPLQLIGDNPDAVRHLAAAVGDDAGNDPQLRARRIQAWSAFAPVRDQLQALAEAGHRADPPRVPVGWLTVHPLRHSPYEKGNVLAVLSSAGKDSAVMKHKVCTEAEAAGALDRVVVIYNSLGTTDSGEPIEWPGTKDLVHRQAARYGVPVIVTERPQGGLYQQLVDERGKFPSSSARWCTSDQKTSQGMKVVTALVDEHRQVHPGEHVIVYYCLGLRAEESAGRAGKPEFVIDRSASNSRRTVIRWHPVIAYSRCDVWQVIEDQQIEYHWAYDLGADRLSCRLCVLATEADLVLAAQLSPQLTDDYVKAEELTDHTFKHGLSIADIRTKAGLARTGRHAKHRRSWYRRMRPGAAIRRNLAPAQHEEQLALFA